MIDDPSLRDATKLRRARARVLLAIAIVLPVLLTLAFSRAVFAQTGGPPKPGETPFFQHIDSTYIGSAVRDSNWLFPAIESVHVIGIVFLVGASVLLDLRLLNGGYLRDQPVSRVWSLLWPIMWIAFAVMLATGVLMLTSESWQCYTSIAFRVKMGLLLAVGANVLLFYFGAYRRMRRDPNWSDSAKQPRGSSRPIGFGAAAARESDVERSMQGTGAPGTLGIPRSAKFCAWASMILWILIVFAGRFIAYW